MYPSVIGPGRLDGYFCCSVIEIDLLVGNRWYNFEIMLKSIKINYEKVN